MPLETRELLSYAVTVVGLPSAIEDFRADLPELLRGEDPDFSAYILRVAEEEIR
jgi:hypothetical protein